MRNDIVNPNPGFVSVQTNEPERNRVLTFTRADDGTLRPSGAYETGGAGDGVPHLTSQGSVVLTGDGRHLLVTNTASDELSVFAVGEDGLSLVGTVTTGSAPRSVTEHAGLVYVLNTGEPSVTGFQLRNDEIRPLAGSTRRLAADADPAQVGFSPDGSVLVVTERGPNTIVVYPVDSAGQLGQPQVQPSSGPTPYGFAFIEHGELVVTEAFGARRGKAAVSSYTITDSGVAPVSRSVGNGRSEICWAVATRDGRYVYTTNFADGAVSRYSAGTGGSVALDDATAGLSRDGRTGLRDEGLSSDDRFLYAIDADARQVVGWAVGVGGSLSPIGSWAALPATAAGLAAS